VGASIILKDNKIVFGPTVIFKGTVSSWLGFKVLPFRFNDRRGIRNNSKFNIIIFSKLLRHIAISSTSAKYSKSSKIIKLDI
jgi:hypothetical protein